MRDFHIFWMQYGMDHYLFLHLIAFIIQKYSAFNDNKALLLRRPNTIYIIASWCCSAQLLGTAFFCVILPPWQRGMLRPGEQQLTPNHPLARREEHSDVQRCRPEPHKTGKFLGFPSIHVSWLPSAFPVAASAWRMLRQQLGMRWPGSPAQALLHPAAGLKEGIRSGLPCSSPWQAQTFS